MSEQVETVPTIGISLQVELPGKKQLVLQSFVSRDADVSEVNGVLDKIRVASERQFAFGMLEVLKMELETQEKLAHDHAERMKIVDENMKREWDRRGKRGDYQLSSKEQNEQRQAYATAEECKRRIAKVKQQIAEEKAKIGAA